MEPVDSVWLMNKIYNETSERQAQAFKFYSEEDINKMKMKGKWGGKLCLARAPNDSDFRSFTVCSELSFIWRQDTRIIIEAGFRTDIGSIPRIFWWYAAPIAGKHAAAAVIHDGLYASHLLKRDVSDLIFYEAMLDLGVRKAKAYAMYKSVRLGGRIPWKKHNNNLNRLVRVEYRRVKDEEVWA